MDLDGYEQNVFLSATLCETECQMSIFIGNFQSRKSKNNIATTEIKVYTMELRIKFLRWAQSESELE